MFKKSVFLFVLILVQISWSQEKKYQSLLWEISGNGLQKKSYMYGTMHVSEKISYHLSDAFFEYLMQADMIANESEPSTWSELYDIFGNMNNNYYGRGGGFYVGFYQNELKKDDLYPLFRGTNYNLIGLLSRTNEMRKDYQEDTYIDMFIYRAGKKYGKKTVGLEDVKESTLNIMKAEANMDRKDVEENRQILKKLLKNKNYNEAMMDYYREKDLDMLDTLSILSSPKLYQKAMLYDRNIDMVNHMIPLMKEGSLFSAVGAAHLPGKRGMIELLRAKGYSVNPVFSEYTDKGKNKKKEIEEFFIKPEFEIKSTTDGMLSLPLYKLVLENENNFESPDLANGGYINVKRSLLKDFMNKDNKAFNPKTLDSLFYENIPGDILEKKIYEEKNYLVYDIKNKTKTNNHQRYRYYITPLEIIAVIMGGEGDYVRKYEHLVFDQINLKTYQDERILFAPKKGGFEVKVPSYYSNIGNNDLEKNYSDIELFAYDNQEKSNYFLIEKTLSESEQLEETEFELKRIHYEFYHQHDLDSTQTELDNKKLTFTSSSKLGTKEIHLFTTIVGTKYYLLGTVGASKEKANDYFSTFKSKPFINDVKYRTYNDSIALFSVEIPNKLNEKLDFSVERNYERYQKKKNHFTSKSKSYSFESPSGNTVELSFYRYHKYETEKSMDSVWNDFRKHLKREYNDVLNADIAAIVDSISYDLEDIKDVKNNSNAKKKRKYYESLWDDDLGFSKIDKNKIELIDEQVKKDDKSEIMTVTAVKPNSQQAIKYKAIFRDGTSYLMKTLVPKGYQNDDPFIEKTFNSFTLYDTVLKPSVFENKFKIFEEDAKSEHDSIRYSALKSIPFLTVTKDDFENIKEFLETFSFEKEESESKSFLFEKLGAIKDPRVISYLEEMYKKEDVNTNTQFSVINALTLQRTKEAYETILKLLEYDLPISDSQYDITNMFNDFNYDLKNSHVLFPGIFQFYSIKEYHEPIVSFTNTLLEENYSNPKKLKSYKKMLLTNAKLEYKRLLSWKQNKDTENQDEYDYGYNENAPVSDLESYLSILYPYKSEKDISELFTKAEKLDISELNISLAAFQLEKENKLPKKYLDKLTSKEASKYVAFQMLHHTKQFDELHAYSNDSIAEAALIYFNDLEKGKDSIAFFSKKEIQFNTKKIAYYFYKITDIDEDSYNKNAERIAGIGFVLENENINPQSFLTLRPKTIIEEKEMDVYIKSAIDRSLNGNRTRANYEKLSDGNMMYGDYYYEDEYYED